jgi:tetraacyldisaccharide 4'-kinase
MKRLRPTAARLLEAVWYEHSRAARLARATLVPLASIMAAAAVRRSYLYDRGVLRVERAGLPVISVGNLRVGGTGKTPLVVWAARKIERLGGHPLIVLRGYGGTSRPLLLDLHRRVPTAAIASAADLGFEVIRDASTSRAAAVSDEALLLAARTRVPVVTAAERIRGARVAQAVGCDCLVLDDGFQHRRLHRDLDIVLTVAGDRNARMIPAGPLREPLSALARADIVIGDGSDECTDLGSMATCRIHPVGFVRDIFDDAELMPLGCVKGRAVFAICGIARPERFFRALSSLGAVVRESRTFPDHYAYDESDWGRIRELARAGEWIVTTEKDLVKLARVASRDAELVALRIEVSVEPEQPIVDRLIAALRPLDQSPSGPHDR